MNDLEILKLIEEKLRVILTKLDKAEWGRLGYLIKSDGHVSYLGLKGCRIENREYVIDLIKELKHLEVIDFDYTALSDISFLKEFNWLRALSLNDNFIQDISILKDLPHLIDIRLVNNRVNDITAIENLKSLKALFLGANKIKDISSIQKLKFLKWLELERNEIQDISPIKELEYLERLYLNSNKIEDITSLKNLKRLEILTLAGNSIKKLPPWITGFDMEIKWETGYKLGSIYLYNNPIASPPSEIVTQGKESIQNYFNSLKGKKKVKLQEIKVLLVGEGMSGKTSLLKLFQGLPFDKDESQTHGINVVSSPALKVNGIVGKNLMDCQIHFWDFGGQEIMHTSHQFFMSERSLYILLLDSRTDSKKYHWLKHIEKFGGDSPIIVVMNKMDANPNYNIEQKRINESFPHIKNRFHRISCQTNEGYPELIKSLEKTIPETSLFDTEVSSDWMGIKEKLVEETKANRYINRESFKKICEDNHVPDESSQQTLLRYLHDLGVVLSFEKLNLANIYVLDPHWVTIGVYKIINSQKIRNGILYEQDLDNILNKERIKKCEYDPALKKHFAYSIEEQQYILNIMMQFELCYKYDNNKNYYIIPDLLPKELTNEPDLNDGQLLHFVITYDYLPSTIIPRLMLRFKNNIVENQQWKYGMILENKEFGCRAKIKEDELAKRIDITIQGKFLSKQKYFSAIRFNIQDINKDFDNLQVQELIPIPGYPEFLVDYEELLGYEQAGRDEYFVGKLGKSFSVSEMLDSVINKYERSKEMGEKNININVQQGNQEVKVIQSASLTATQKQTLSQEIKNIQGLFKNLKEDILSEVDMEFDNIKEKKRIQNELRKTEIAFSELEKATQEGKEYLPESTKGRIEEFIENLSDENSRFNKALKLVSKGTEKVQKLGRFYNNIAPFFALPSIPPFLLDKKN